MEELKSRLGLGRPRNGDGAEPRPSADSSAARPEPTQEEKAQVVGLIVAALLAEYRPWLNLAGSAIPPIAEFIQEGLELVHQGLSELETMTTPYNDALIKQRSANRKKQFDSYLEHGFSREEALQLVVAGFHKDNSLGEKLADNLGKGVLKALEDRAKKA